MPVFLKNNDNAKRPNPQLKIETSTGLLAEEMTQIRWQWLLQSPKIKGKDV